MRFIKLDSNAVMPSRATHGSAGYDLCTPTSVVIPPRSKVTIMTELALVGMPENVVALIWPKSGPSHKLGSDILGGVIDSDYEKNIGVIYHNNKDEAIGYSAGDSIAQIILQEYLVVENDITMDERDGGFGSTNK